MSKTLNTDLIYEVLSVVEEIPEGCVATYGQIARLCGMPRGARIVGYAMAATGGNVVVSVLFGMLSNLIYLLFARYFNERCDTHIDPPAVAIEICSLILWTLL